VSLPNDKQTPKELKVTDKRIFTADGDIRDEFKTEIRPAVPEAQAPRPEPASPPAPAAEPRPEARREGERRADAEKGVNPGTPFATFIEPLLLQAYVSLGMMPNPYQPDAKPRIDAAAARQMIDILVLLKEKTAGNLTPEEDAFLQDHLGDLKLAFVQRTKSIS
jgi:hypothetical protein